MDMTGPRGWADDALAARTRSLLRAHVPLSLLLDLAAPSGPDSSTLYVAERPDLRWIEPQAS